MWAPANILRAPRGAPRGWRARRSGAGPSGPRERRRWGVRRGEAPRKERSVIQFDLNGRRAVVTGAAQGFGRAITERFLASGARVSMWDLDGEESRRAAAALDNGKGAVFTHTVDVADRAAVDEATRATVDALGGIDILVANAGIAGPEPQDLGIPGRRVGEGHRDRPAQRLLLLNRAVIPHMIAGATTAASSTSRRWPARKAMPTPRPTARRRPASSR
jgi:NAD(P)-dependent dehydrogenase (short-subunit alcohol dehydrogenase family)